MSKCHLRCSAAWLREGQTFYHYDFYAQALAKIERGHTQDRADVISMLDMSLVAPAKLREL